MPSPPPPGANHLTVSQGRRLDQTDRDADVNFPGGTLPPESGLYLNLAHANLGPVFRLA